MPHAPRPWPARHPDIPHLLLSALLATAGIVPAPAWSADNAVTPAHQVYEIAAGPLGEALVRFAGAAGISVQVDSRLVEGRRTPGLHGSHAVTGGLARLLADSGLEAVERSPGTYVLRPLPTPSAAATDTPTTLAPVKVTAAANRDVATEDTGSYAARGATVFKSAQSLREIPQSITVVTRQRMDDQQMTSVTEALRSATGVIATGYFGQETPSARGYSMNEQHDGVPQQGGASGLAPDLAIYDRVEILRGAAGLLTGRGEPGGAVNYVRKRPQTSFSGNASLAAGSWNNRRAEVDVTAPLAADGALRGRVVGAYQERDFFYDVAHNRRSTLFLTLEYDFSPRTTLGVSHTNVRRDGHSFWGLPTYTNGEFIESRSAFVGPDKNYLMKIEETSADLKHRFDNGWQARAAVTRRTHRFDGYGAYNNTGGVDPLTGLGGLGIGYIQSVTQRDGADVGIDGPVELLGRSHTLAFGYSKAVQDYIGGANYRSVSNVDLLHVHDFGDQVPTTINTKNQTITGQAGYYGMARLKLADPLTLVLGGRWTDYESKSRRKYPSTAPWTASDARAKGEFAPYGGVIWDLNRELSLYASYSDIFVPQTQFAFGGRILDPRVGWQAETGLKGAFFDGALNASIALFRIRDTNRPLLDTTHAGCDGTPTGSCYLAAGLVQSQGWETEISGSPVRGWNLSAGYTYNETEYLRDSDAANLGQRFNTGTPKHLFKLWSHYRFDHSLFDGALAGWSVGGGLHAQSMTSNGVSTATVRQRKQAGYTLASLQVGYRMNRQWQASLQVNNLFDRKYFELVSGTGFANIYGEPRNAMLTLRHDF